eukprot:6181342-Pleurochrysis_carterae.AAC.3
MASWAVAQQSSTYRWWQVELVKCHWNPFTVQLCQKQIRDALQARKSHILVLRTVLVAARAGTGLGHLMIALPVLGAVTVTSALL